VAGRTKCGVTYDNSDLGKLTSTTVRFFERDIAYLEKLQDKLGLGRIQVIRLAIRRLAEIEGILKLPSS
jgi:hypothetical protein